MNAEICIHDACTGCSACASACPKHCIKMIADDEGFLRPFIDELNCVNCGICKKTCPVNQVVLDDGVKPETWVSRIKDLEIRKLSSSGGIFSALSEQIIRRDGVIVAAGIDEHNQVVHKICKNREELDELRRSKYVQSRIGNAYRDAKDLLDSGIDLLFCGTPCQVGGLIAFLGKEYTNLVTVDFVCHGVPTPFAWEKYLEFQKEIHKSNIKEVSFRDKEFGWINFSLKLLFDDGKQYCKTVSEDYYLRSFIMDLTLRTCCYNCKFKQIHRLSDITLADFWGLKKKLPEWDDNTGVSLVMIHTDKGKLLYKSCEDMVEKKRISFSDAISRNPSMIKSVKTPVLRSQFISDMKKMRFDRVHNKYCGLSLASKLRRKIAEIKSRHGLSCTKEGNLSI